MFPYCRSGNFRGKNNSRFKFLRVIFSPPDGSAMKRVYVYLIFACLIFAAQATGENFPIYSMQKFSTRKLSVKLKTSGTWEWGIYGLKRVGHLKRDRAVSYYFLGGILKNTGLQGSIPIIT